MTRQPDDIPEKRPRDIIDFVEQCAGEVGNFEAVDETYYEEFLRLTCFDLERMVNAMMLSQELEVRRLSKGRTDLAAVREVSRFMCNGMALITIGLMRFDAFGRLQMYARVGPDPDERTSEAIQRRLIRIQPLVEDEVRRTLPWLLSRESGQGRLPV